LQRGYQPRVVYDIGASTGIWSEVIARVLPEAQYHLFEPLAEVAEEYRRDIPGRLARLPNLTLHPVALGGANGKAIFYVAGSPYCSSLNDRGEIPEVKERIEVDKYRLDDYRTSANLPLPDIIKIDCQGAEDVIIRGGEGAVRNAQVLLLETWFARCYGPDTPLLGEIIELLRPMGFSLVEIGERFYDEKHRLYSVDAFFFAESLLENTWLPAEE
jgi:FkbM family methyltransferase